MTNYKRHLLIFGILILESISQNTWAVSGNEAEKWAEDINVFATKFAAQEKSFDAKRKAEFLGSIESIRADLNNLDEDRIVTRIMQAVALAHNAHTTLLVADFGPVRAQLPIRLYCFEDGFYIVKARSEHEELLRKRIVDISGHSIDTVLDSVTITVEDENGKRSEHTLKPDPLLEDRVDEQPWWHMTPMYESADTNWKHALKVSKKRHPFT
jgi:hypothetical protein